MLRMTHSYRTPNPRSMVPIFAVGGTVSGYASMGSAEDLADKMLETRPHVVQEALEKIRDSGQNKFKSKFAKELNEQDLNISEIKVEQDLRKSVRAEIKISEGDVPQEAFYSKSDLIKLKLENEELKLKIEECLIEDERYRNLQQQLECLTEKFAKVSHDDVTAVKNVTTSISYYSFISCKHPPTPMKKQPTT